MPQKTHSVAVSAIIRNDYDEILLVKTLARGWEPPGGSMDTGEGIFDAVHREVMEETKTRIQIEKMIGVYSNQDKDMPKIVFSFLCHVLDNNSLSPDNEVSEVKWVKIEDVLDFITNGAIRQRVCDAIDFITSNEQTEIFVGEYITKPEYNLLNKYIL